MFYLFFVFCAPAEGGIPDSLYFFPTFQRLAKIRSGVRQRMH